MVDKNYRVKQLEIEERWLQHQDIKPDNSQTMQELFGNADDWYMELGPYQLLLDPVNGTWIYYDRIHDQWSDSGFKAGQVLFSLSGEDIVITEREDKSQKEDSPLSPREDETACPHCGEKIMPGSKFCSNCGNKITAPGTRTCKNCGFIIEDQRAKFCNECGSPVEGLTSN